MLYCLLCVDWTIIRSHIQHYSDHIKQCLLIKKNTHLALMRHVISKVTSNQSFDINVVEV